MSILERIYLVIGLWLLASVLLVLVWGLFLTRHERREMVETLRWLHDKDAVLGSAMRMRR
jgi:hypothetical protein